jgi:hypothetical protein
LNNTRGNNNNNNNNRRRGRGNNNRPQGGGPQGGGSQGGGPQVNRIDSRARGNAPQLLEKYRKLAHDAHLNGDRVTAEYYLQFADHYFRVIADTRLRQEEARARRDDRWQENGESGPRDDSDESGEFSVEADFPAFDQPPVYTRRDREDRPVDRGTERAVERTAERSGEPAPERGNARGGERGNDSRRRDERPAQSEAETPREADQPQDGEAGDARSVYEPPENPFVRTERGDRGLRPRREGPRDAQRDVPRDGQRDAPRDAPREARRPRREDRPQVAEEAPATTGLDPTLLPPAISVTRREPEGDGEAQAAPAPRRRARRKPVDDAGEALESVG